MKSTGVVRKLDDLGRVTIPKEIRRTHGIGTDDGLEIFVDGDKIILQKYEPGCKLCGNSSDVSYIRGSLICKTCVSEIAEARGA